MSLPPDREPRRIQRPSARSRNYREWTPNGIHVNRVLPNALFDTGLWTNERKAKSTNDYGMSIDEYTRRNLLRTEVTSVGVGRLAAAMSSPVVDATAGAQLPIDGG